ncbi:MAG TPA: alpha/beta hydrolase [Longimicrobium sp.]|uniref:alpha/beta fold hydrolase n=1 Tax=Longimicrobium sp. TaxID=2029185 RepID=UPI002ED91B6C
MLAGLTLLVLIAAITGAVYEAEARRDARKRFAPRGRLVDVGGRRIHLDCRGAGSPTVVMENGLDTSGPLSWNTVHDDLAAITRTCAYSRAGMMWSDPAPGAFHSDSAARDLHRALTAAGERAPWVLVGHSMGGPYALVFTARHPRETAGLVLVDAAHPYGRERMGEAAGTAPGPLRRMRNAAILALGPTLARLGVMRLMAPRAAPADWTPQMAAAQRALYPPSSAALVREARAMDETLRRADASRALGDRPLIVLTAITALPGESAEQEAKRLAAWKRLGADQASWSSRGRQQVVDATHYIHFNRPDVVVDAVRDLVRTIRAEAPRAAR